MALVAGELIKGCPTLGPVLKCYKSFSSSEAQKISK